MEDGRPVAAVWKATWLPPSQTFVRNQVLALSTWRPVLVGVRRVPGLDLVPDLAPFGSSLLARAAARASRATGYLGVYDAFLRRAGVRVVHAHFGTGAVQVLPVVRRAGLPLVVTFHGYDVMSEPVGGSRRARRYRADLVRVFDQAYALVAVSEVIRERLVELGAPPEKVRVHYIGIPVTEASEPPDVGARSGVVFVGRLIESKGVEDLLRAVSLIPSRPAVRIVGDGPEKDRARRLAETLGVDATFLGHLPPPEVARVLREAAVFCAPSRTSPTGGSEAFGMVYLEAALHGLPVVAYRHGGVPEAVADGVTGMLATEGDVEALSDLLAALVADPARADRLGRAGRQRVLTSFDIRTRTAELEALYDEAAGRSR